MRFGSDRVAKILCTPGDGVLIDVLVDCFHRPVLDIGGRREIRKALREIDGSELQSFASHLPNY
jgi:hypothetical protein